MPYKRVIPIVLIDNERAVKTVQFLNPTYIGDPVNICKIFSDKEVDELCVLNISKSRAIEGPNFEIIKKISYETFVPITYGGGVSKLEHFEKLFGIGVEKVVVNSLFWTNPAVITKAIELFGSQSIVLSLDFHLQRKKFFQTKKLFVKTPSQINELIPFDSEKIINSINSIDFGEILLTDVSREGMYSGINLDLLRAFKSIKCPLIINGGLSSLNEIADVLMEKDVVAVAGGSMFTFSRKHRAVLLSYPSFEKLNRSYYD